MTDNLITGQTAVGVEVTGAWHRLLQGTGEVWTLMENEKSKRRNARMKVEKKGQMRKNP